MKLFGDMRMKDSLFQKEILVKMNIKNRYDYNKKLLTLLCLYFEKHKDVRFIQALHILGIIDKDGTDRFYEEPRDTYEKATEKLLEDILS